MKCLTVKKDKECPFAIKKGCSYINNSCNVVNDKCIDCNNIFSYEDKQYCKIYVNPDVKWMNGRCPSCTVVLNKKVNERKINPMKASKRKHR